MVDVHLFRHSEPQTQSPNHPTLPDLDTLVLVTTETTRLIEHLNADAPGVLHPCGVKGEVVPIFELVAVLHAAIFETVDHIA
jgi:hypothetical protein